MIDRLDAITSAGLRPVDGRSLAFFRILFGAILTVAMARYIAKGWVEIHYVQPQFFFKFTFLEWVTVPPPAVLYAMACGMCGLAACITVGLFTRPALLLFGLSFAYWEAMDVTNYLNHYILVILLVGELLLTPCGHTWSLDNWRLGRPQRNTIPAWCLWMLQFQVAVVYCSASIAKIGSDWLVHGQPMGIWLSSRAHLPVIGWIQQFAWVPLAMSWTGFLYDLSVPFLLLWKRSRPYAFALVLLFHSLTHLLFNIGVFPFLMTAAATLFFAADWPARFDRQACQPASAATYRPWMRAVAVAALLVATLQIAFPQRHLLREGNVLWHEQGMRFSWRVMLREKNGAITYYVTDKASGRTWQVPPGRYLNRRQEAEFSSQPDLVRQLAQHIAKDFGSKGHDVAVRVEALVSLNGRKAQPMIDDQVDLTAPLPNHWILPAPTGPPLTSRAGRL